MSTASASVAPSPVPAAAGGNVRWTVCGLLFFAVTINYLDRQLLSILKKPLSDSLGWSDADYGWITAAFSFAYAFGYLVGGRFMDRFGVKRGIPLVVFLWSTAAMAHGLCAYLSTTEQFHLEYPWFSWAKKGLVTVTLALPMTAAGFMLARIALGLTQGGIFPGSIKTIAEWFPAKERALATGLFNAGSNIGAILCLLVVPAIYARLGWEKTFYVTGATGYVWLLAWWFLYDQPEKHPRVSAAELAHIRGDRPVEENKVRVPWLALLRYRAVWAYVMAGILAGPAWGVYQSFMPDFLNKRFNLSLQQTGTWSAVFFAIAVGGGVAGGWFAGKLIARGWTVIAARKLALLACALSVVPVFFAPFAGSVWLTVLIVGIAGSAHQGWSANLFSVVADTMPKDSISSVVGLGGFVAYMAGGFVNGITGEILQRTGSYVPVFAYISGMYLLSLLILHLLIPGSAKTAAPASRP
jgi:ACS family hexuronate transporter-like MFS transporter